MASDVSKAAGTGMRAFIVPDPRITFPRLSATHSSYTQAGPRPGVPVDENDPPSRMHLHTGGTQAAGKALEIYTRDGGMPGVEGGGFVYRDQTVSTTYFGRDVPSLLGGWQWLNWTADASTTNRWVRPSIVRLESGDLLCVATGSGTTTTGSTSTYKPVIYRFDGATGAWAAGGSVVVTPTGTTSSDLHCCLCPVPGGRVLLFYWVAGLSGFTQIEMQYSDDDGATWALGARAVLGADPIASTGYTLGRLRACYNNGQILLVAHRNDGTPPATEDEALIQFASSDLGCSFSLVYTFDLATDEAGIAQDVLPIPGGGFMVTYQNPANDDLEGRRVSSAWESMGDVATIFMVPGSYQEDMCAWIAEDGIWYASAWVSASGNQAVFRSRDHGVTWAPAHDSSNGIWIGGTSANHYTEFSAAECRGTTVFVARVVAGTATNDLYSVGAFYLGGHSSVTMPNTSSGGDDDYQQAWSQIWLAAELPDNVGLTKTTTGAPTVELTVDGLHIVSSAAERNFYTYTTTNADPQNETISLWEVKLVSGGSATVSYVALRHRNADNVNDYCVDVNLETDGYTVRDTNAGTTLGVKQSLVTTANVQIMVCLGSAKVTTFHRVATGSDVERSWTIGVQNETVSTNTATPKTTGSISWGAITVGGATESYHKLQTFVMQLGGTSLRSHSLSNPAKMHPRRFAAQGVRVPSGVRVIAQDGPAVIGDYWTIRTRYDYGIENLHPSISPSPRQPWRSTQTAIDEVIAWNLSLGNVNAKGLNGVWGIALLNTNIPTFTVAHRDSASWVTRYTVVNGYSGLYYTREGNSVTVDTGGASAARWIAHNELVGGYVVLDTGGTPKYRRIIANSEGHWHATTQQRPKIILDPDEVDNTEATSGLMRLVFPNVAASWYVVDGNNIRITIPAGTSPEGYWYIGDIVIGSLAVLPRQYSATRAIERSAQTELRRSRGGTGRTRVLGPSRRVVEFGWEDGIDQSQIGRINADASASVDYITQTATGVASPIGSPADTALLMDGLIDRLDGSHTPVVYLPSLTRDAYDGGIQGTAPNPRQTFFHREELVYGRLDDSIERQTILGNESENELVTISRIKLTEER